MTELDADVKILSFQQRILKYWDERGRKNLPWRLTKDAWQILLTEVLLRKTTSQQVADFFPVFSQWSPKVILDMELDELTRQLKPLGLSQVRAVLFKQLAEGFIDKKTELFQSDEYLRSFPGIGQYISNSVRCCVFNEPLPALDTNMIRVIQRVFGFESKRSRPREDKKLWAFAKTLVPKDRPAEYNWGVLDIGAEICTLRKPKCNSCPLQDICLYFQQSKPDMDILAEEPSRE